MKRKITAGIDIGTSQIKIVVTDRPIRSKKPPRIIGKSITPSKGLRNGYVTNSAEAVRSLKKAIIHAEKSAKVKIKTSYLSVGGVSLGSTVSTGSIIISRADSEITELDIAKAIEASERLMPPSVSLNRKIIHTIPLEFRLDGKEVLGRVTGMKGVKLEAKTLFITCLEHHLNDLIGVVEDAGIEVDDVIASPLASSLVTLTKAHKIAGCVLVNIGAETTSMVVYENNLPVALDVLSVGSMDTTNAVALGLRISLEEAENVKIGGISGFDTQKKMEEIRIAELRKIFSRIEDRLKSIGKSELLPAGIVILGGGATVARIEELARDELRLPSRRATIQLLGPRTGNSTLDPSFSIAYGLCVLGSTDDEDGSTGIKLVKKTGINILTWVKQFLP